MAHSADILRQLQTVGTNWLICCRVKSFAYYSCILSFPQRQLDGVYQYWDEWDITMGACMHGQEGGGICPSLKML